MTTLSESSCFSIPGSLSGLSALLLPFVHFSSNTVLSQLYSFIINLDIQSGYVFYIGEREGKGFDDRSLKNLVPFKYWSMSKVYFFIHLGLLSHFLESSLIVSMEFSPHGFMPIYFIHFFFFCYSFKILFSSSSNSSYLVFILILNLAVLFCFLIIIIFYRYLGIL